MPTTARARSDEVNEVQVETEAGTVCFVTVFIIAPLADKVKGGLPPLGAPQRESGKSACARSFILFDELC